MQPQQTLKDFLAEKFPCAVVGPSPDQRQAGRFFLESIELSGRGEMVQSSLLAHRLLEHIEISETFEEDFALLGGLCDLPYDRLLDSIQSYFTRLNWEYEQNPSDRSTGGLSFKKGDSGLYVNTTAFPGRVCITVMDPEKAFMHE